MEYSINNSSVSSKDKDERRVIYGKSDNIEIMINGKAAEVLVELFQSLRLNIKMDGEYQ